MYVHQQKLNVAEVANLRKMAGVWLKQLRETRGMSQRELSVAVGVDYYTFISQLETGRGRIPTDRYEMWAKALQVEPKKFVIELMRYYDPVTYGILFGKGA